MSEIPQTSEKPAWFQYEQGLFNFNLNTFMYVVERASDNYEIRCSAIHKDRFNLRRIRNYTTASSHKTWDQAQKQLSNMFKQFSH